jgi:hypothetical protein
MLGSRCRDGNAPVPSVVCHISFAVATGAGQRVDANCCGKALVPSQNRPSYFHVQSTRCVNAFIHSTASRTVSVSMKRTIPGNTQPFGRPKNFTRLHSTFTWARVSR